MVGAQEPATVQGDAVGGRRKGCFLRGGPPFSWRKKGVPLPSNSPPLPKNRSYGLSDRSPSLTGRQEKSGNPDRDVRFCIWNVSLVRPPFHDGLEKFSGVASGSEVTDKKRGHAVFIYRHCAITHGEKRRCLLLSFGITANISR